MRVGETGGLASNELKEQIKFKIRLYSKQPAFGSLTLRALRIQLSEDLGVDCAPYRHHIKAAMAALATELDGDD